MIKYTPVKQNRQNSFPHRTCEFIKDCVDMKQKQLKKNKKT